MSGFPELFAIVVALYAWECAIVLAPGTLVLHAWGRRLRAVRGATFVGARRLAFANPWPGAGDAFVIPDPAVPPGADAAAGAEARVRFVDIVAMRDRVRREGRPPRALGALQCVLLLVALPGVAAAKLLVAFALPLFGAIALVHVALVVLYRRRRGGADGEAWQVALSPLMSARVADLAARHAFAAFDPLAVAFVLCEPAEFWELARLAQGGPGAADPARQRVLAEAGLLAEHLALAPEGIGGERSWCPACGRRFVLESGACPDCGGPLRRLVAQQAREVRDVLARIAERRARVLAKSR